MSFISDVLAASVTQLKVQTAWGPDLVIDQPFAQSPSAAPSPTMSILKPKLSFTDASGNVNTFAPYGDPGDTKWPLLAIGLGAVGTLLLWRLLQRKAR